MSKKLKTEYIIHCFAILIISIFCCIHIQNLNYPVVLNDEFGYWGNAVSIAGYNWKELIAETPYYSLGYSIWLVPIVLIFPTNLWYKAAIGLNVIFLICSYFLCYKFTRRIFVDIEKTILQFISLCVILYPSNIVYAQVTWSESLLYMLMWLATYLLVKLEKNFSYKNFVGITIILGYMYFVHSRAIGIVIVGIACLFLIAYKHKKNFKNFLIPVILLGIIYFFNTQIKNFQISNLWNNSEMSAMNNVGLNTNTFSKYINSLFNNLRLFIESLGAKMIYIILGTGLTFPILCFKILTEWKKTWKKENFFSYLSKENTIIKLWCILSVIVMWGICSIQMIEWSGRKDIIVYGRYMENALGPALALGLIYLLTRIKETKIGLLISLGLIIVGIKNVYWRVLEAQGIFNTICSPLIGGFYEESRDVKKAFLYIVIISITLFIIFYFIQYLKLYNIKAIIIIVTMSFYFVILGYKAGSFTNNWRDSLDSRILPFKEQISMQSSKEEIYYIKNKEYDLYSVNPKYLQFMIPNCEIHVIEYSDIASILSKDTLILTNSYDIKTNVYLEELEKIYEITSTNMLKLYSIDNK